MSNYNYSFFKAFSSRLIATLLSLAMLVGLFPGAMMTAEATTDTREIPSWLSILGSGPNFVYFKVDWDTCPYDDLYMRAVDGCTGGTASFATKEWDSRGLNGGIIGMADVATNWTQLGWRVMDGGSAVPADFLSKPALRRGDYSASFFSFIVRGSTGSLLMGGGEDPSDNAFRLLNVTGTFKWGDSYDGTDDWARRQNESYMTACGVVGGGDNPLKLIMLEGDSLSLITKTINDVLSHLPHGNWVHPRSGLWIETQDIDGNSGELTFDDSTAGFVKVKGSIRTSGRIGGCLGAGIGTIPINWTIPVIDTMSGLDFVESGTLGAAKVTLWNPSFDYRIETEDGVFEVDPSSRTLGNLIPGSYCVLQGGFSSSGCMRTMDSGYVPKSTYKLHYNAGATDAFVRKDVHTSDLYSDEIEYPYDPTKEGKGGEDVIAAGSLAAGDTLFDRPGYTFKGWSTVQNQSEHDIAAGEVTATYIPADKLNDVQHGMLSDNTYGKVTDLYAIWEGQDYDLTYPKNCSILLTYKRKYCKIKQYIIMKRVIYMKRIVSIQDISCFGKCSLTVALPITSAMGIETCVIPTAVLSTHTGSGFEGYTYRDLTYDIPAIARHWKTLNLHLDAICTGYLGSFEQIKIVSDFFDDFKTDDNLIIIDPVMGDKGRYYAGFNDDFAHEMRKMCGKADVILPNLTEAALLLDEEYAGDGYDENYIKELLIRLSQLGSKIAVLTGVSFNESSQGVMSYNRETGEFSSYFNDNIPGYFHSTGDVFSATLCGALVRGFDMGKAIKIAVDFTVDCIQHTLGKEKDHWYGVMFEECIPDLIKQIKLLSHT